jgi:hypothetical protein
MSSLFGTDTPSWLAPYLPEGNGWFLAVGVILLTVLSAVVSLAAVAFALTRLPPDYFVNPHAQRPIDRHPLLKILLAILRNIFGYFLVALGIVLSLPGRSARRFPGEGSGPALVFDTPWCSGRHQPPPQTLGTPAVASSPILGLPGHLSSFAPYR